MPFVRSTFWCYPTSQCPRSRHCVCVSSCLLWSFLLLTPRRFFQQCHRKRQVYRTLFWLGGCITKSAHSVLTFAPGRFEQFINLVSGSNLDIGKGLQSCTEAVQIAGAFDLGGRRVILIDTPGFDDTTRSDTDVLKLVAAFLETSYVTCEAYIFLTKNASRTDTNEVPSSPVSSTSTGSPISG